MAVAQVYADLSYAKRLKVGAVLVKDDRVISVGYNGMPTGMDNECEIVVGQTKTMPAVPILQTKPQLVHAEMNVIAFAAKNGVATNQCIMYITDSPCAECAKLIKQSGIKEVYYDREYRDLQGVYFLRGLGVIVEKLDGNEEKSGTTETAS